MGWALIHTPTIDKITIVADEHDFPDVVGLTSPDLELIR